MLRLYLRSLFAPPVSEPPPEPDPQALDELARAPAQRARHRLGRSLAIRQMDAGSCNGCELEIHALDSAVYALERHGIRFVASPRHADVLLVTGPVTRNMAFALQRAFDCTPPPRRVVAAGDCACGCGVFAPSHALAGEDGAVERVIPVDLHIRGCPPTPLDLLRGLPALLEAADGRIAPAAGIPSRTG